jgi:hypothetical protein
LGKTIRSKIILQDQILEQAKRFHYLGCQEKGGDREVQTDRKLGWSRIKCGTTHRISKNKIREGARQKLYKTTSFTIRERNLDSRWENPEPNTEYQNVFPTENQRVYKVRLYIV